MTLRDAKRICNDYEICETCPLYNYEKIVYDVAYIEKECSKWLKEHPEPIYPTYYNWLTSEGVYDFGAMISPEFAEKYGVKPIENASNVVE